MGGKLGTLKKQGVGARLKPRPHPTCLNSLIWLFPACTPSGPPGIWGHWDLTDPSVPLGQARGTLQNRVLLWKEQSEASRGPSRAHSPGLLGPVLGPPYPSGRLTPTRLDMVRLWAPPPPFAPPAPFAGSWGLTPPAWSLPPYAAPLGPPWRPGAVSAPPWWPGRLRSPYAAWDWG